ncbi:MAG: ABC-ATPase domain-containing protein [Actinomycetaceae bacterium]|nr:ABC-ATPase domain-containing protein [Actinomycetaceae bacterium]
MSAYGNDFGGRGAGGGGREQRQRPGGFVDDPTARRGQAVNLFEQMERLDGRPYGAYKQLIGIWDFGVFDLVFQHVQSDPFAPPSNFIARIPLASTGIPADVLADEDARVAAADYLVRCFHSLIGGTPMAVAKPGQEILQRSSCVVGAEGVELRFSCQLPASGRTIQGVRAARSFDGQVPESIIDAVDVTSQRGASLEGLRAHIAAYKDQQRLREIMSEEGWLAFVADGSVLARASGISDAPMSSEAGVLAFESPETLRVSVELPHAGTVQGMALRPGITLIVGGGYHGKSTLLNALERCVYNHIPGDGRELCATRSDAVKVRAEDGRAVAGVDISPFVSALPAPAGHDAPDTTRFSTANASGSTSQAAAIMEALEVGSRLLLIDEDTSATNLMIRDARMRALVAGDKEPLTPLVDRISALSQRAGDLGQVSTIVVMGGSGDYLDIADTVIMMDNFACVDVSARAAEVSASMPAGAGVEDNAARLEDFPDFARRVPVEAKRTGDRHKTKTSGLRTIILDKSEIDVGAVAQFVDPGQVEAAAWAVRAVVEVFANNSMTVDECIDKVEIEIEKRGLDALTSLGHGREKPAYLVRARRYELAAALNRYRALRVV